MNTHNRAVAEQCWQAFRDGRPPTNLRPDVLRSWQRSATQVAVSIDHAPLAADAPDRWRDTPAARAFESIATELAAVAVDGDFVAAMTDAWGTIVWATGGRTMRRRAEQVAFEPGGRWGEEAVGTNALALALRERRPATVWSAEHYAPIVHDWVCYAAPVMDPSTGLPCGVVDLSTTWRRATPLALTTVTALARLMEHALTSLPAFVTDEIVELRTLGRREILVGGRPLVLPPRQVELLTVLTLAPNGLALEQLHDRLHGDRHVAPASTKAEMSYLRRALGDHVASRPYRVLETVRADHIQVLNALDDGDLDRVLDLYGGPLLATSDAPAIVDQRHVIDVAVRAAVVHNGHPDRIARLAAAAPHDAYLQELVVEQLAPGDPRRSIAVARLDLLAT